MYKSLATRCAARVLCGGPVVCVSSLSKDGVPDVMAAAWNTPFDNNIIEVVLDLGHTTTQNIKDTGKFVVTIPAVDSVAAVMQVGSIHGREVGDKFAHFKLASEDSELLGIKVLTQQLAYLECELIEPEIFSKTGILLGKVVNLYVEDQAWDDKEECFKDGVSRTFHYIKEDLAIAGGNYIQL